MSTKREILQSRFESGQFDPLHNYRERGEGSNRFFSAGQVVNGGAGRADGLYIRCASASDYICEGYDNA
jgi:hypothetical protein